MHFLALGSSGSGKSTLILNMIYDMIRTSNSKRNHGIIVLEPHGDLSQRIAFAEILGEDRLVYISSTINREAKTAEPITAVFNPFDNDGSEEMRYVLTQELTSAIAELLASSEHTSTHNITVQMATLLRPCIAVTLASPEPSMNTLKRFFLENNNEDLIELGRNFPHPQIQLFFSQDWHSDEYKVTRKSIRTKLSYFMNDTHLYHMFSGKSTFSMEKAINSGAVIVFHIPKGAGAFVTSVIGRLAIAYVFALMLRREAVAPKDRKPVYMFIDELQEFVTASVAASTQQARKYGLGLIMATQSLKQIADTNVRNSILTNTHWKAVSIIDADSRAAMAKEMNIKDIERLTKLKSLHFMISKNDGEAMPFVFRVPILSDHLFLSGKDKQKRLEYIINESGVYSKIPPPPAPPPPYVKPIKEDKKQKKSDNDNPFTGNKPAF